MKRRRSGKSSGPTCRKGSGSIRLRPKRRCHGSTPTRTSENGQETTPEPTPTRAGLLRHAPPHPADFHPSNGERCALTGETDTIVVKGYVTKPWGFNYPSQTWRHPLSPYYRVKETSNEWLPLHFKSSAIGYRQWVGLTLKTKTGETALPADTVSLFLNERAKEIGINLPRSHRVGILAAGYAMDNMKPLDFTEAMLPLISTGDKERDFDLAGCAAAMVQAAEAAASLLLNALKVALYSDRKQGQPDNASAPLAAARARFWADTENAFYDTLRGLAAKQRDPSGSIYTEAKERWRKVIRDAALAIFDDLAPIDAPESPDIKNIVNARSLLYFALEGRNKAGAPIWNALNLTMPEKREKKDKANGKGRKAA